MFFLEDGTATCWKRILIGFQCCLCRVYGLGTKPEVGPELLGQKSGVPGPLQENRSLPESV